ncbi:immunoglobulin A1 protease autotransporter [Zeugodacus cucurbitae]|nr:immunoglobulin A1 protease autotransporter [Zeugodacus cucurbitae]
MRFLAIAFAVIAVVRAATLPADYLPPVVDNSLPVQEYLAPVTDVAQDQTVLADDGYRYKAVHRLKLRHRRDVNELPENEYLPPAEEAQNSAVEESVEPAAEVKTDLADDGYRYKTVRRLKYRKRRDVDEVPQNEYLPPTEEAQESVVAEVAESAEPAAEEGTELAADGYRYKTVRRLKYRKRRDVDDVPQNEYLPPTEEAQESVVAEVAESPEPAAEEGTELAADGYRYKTVRRLKYRKRRDVDEVPQNEYLPPTEEAQESVVAEVAESADPAAEEGTELAADGYRYKTVRRLKYRKRRDVDDVPQNEYLPPTEEAQESVVAEVAESAEPAAEEGTELAADGYRYKTVRRLKYRKRRDVDELPQNEYLPPTEEAQESVVAEVAESAEPAAEEGTELAADGYRYKAVRRLKYRKRRDVDEVPQNEYLPPTEEAQESVVAEVAEPTEPAAEEGTELAADGYRYKAVRRLKYRKRRDVDEVPQNEYLPPTDEAQESVVAEVAESAEPAAEEGTELADDGYRYKTVRRLKYRKRRDVDEVPQNEYLPPTEEAQESVVAEVAESVEPAAEEGTELAADGYRYKTVRRLKYRKRRDVDEVPQNEYLPPTEEAQESVVAEVAESAEPAVEEGTELAADGYHYKTARRLKYRKRRDVDEVPQNEYLPPTEEAQESVVAEVAESAEPAAEEGTELAADGYRYKTVRRLKYRKRRDVDEVPQNEYLPPTEEAQESVVAEVAESAEPAAEEGTELAADGYRYKTVRRLKYRKRRDVNELPQNEYLPPVEEAQETAVTEVAEPAEPAADDATVLADDGYRYKVVRRLKYRHRRDVNELPANEYLPPTEEGQEVAEQQPEEETAALADDGYRYKTVRRLKYRRH